MVCGSCFKKEVVARVLINLILFQIHARKLHSRFCYDIRIITDVRWTILNKRNAKVSGQPATGVGFLAAFFGFWLCKRRIVTYNSSTRT